MTIMTWIRYGILAALPVIASCSDRYDDCRGCGSYTPFEISLGLVAGNFNAAGGPSIITTSSIQYHADNNAGDLKSYLSTGAGTFAAPTTTPAGTNPLFLAAADLNGDNLPDLVSASYDDAVLTVFFNNPQAAGTFNAPLSLSSPGASQVAIGDMNGDGLKDLVSADFNVSLFVQTAPGTFANAVGLYSGGANWVAVGDLNGDGIADVALTDSTGVKLLLHTGAAGSLTYGTPVSIFDETPNANLRGANLIAIADMNGDGFNDLVITDQGPTGGGAPTVNILYQNAAQPGQFLAPVSYPITTNSRAESIVVADVNGDGLPDIVIGGSQGLTVLLQSASGTTVSAFVATNYAVYDVTQIALADVNGDGLLDILVPVGVTQPTVNGVVTNNPGVLLQTSPGVFASETDLP